MKQCGQICANLKEKLNEQSMDISIHSVFHSAANFSTPVGMVTILSAEKGLQPYSVVLDSPFLFEKLQGDNFRISEAGISQSDVLVISFELAVSKKLFLDHKPEWTAHSAKNIAEFLRKHREQGLTELVFGQCTDVFTKFLFPRIETMRKAVREKREEAIIQSVRRMAGGGIGLTPSSDDFLCGYLAGMSELGKSDLSERMMRAAAECTNDISASLLLRAGEGLFSNDVLKLISCLEAGVEGAILEDALRRVAAFGSSSGCDFLTGLYFGIMDHYENGGIKSEETGSSEKCLL